MSLAHLRTVGASYNPLTASDTSLVSLVVSLLSTGTRCSHTVSAPDLESSISPRSPSRRGSQSLKKSEDRTGVGTSRKGRYPFRDTCPFEAEKESETRGEGQALVRSRCHLEMGRFAGGKA